MQWLLGKKNHSFAADFLIIILYKQSFVFNEITKNIVAIAYLLIILVALKTIAKDSEHENQNDR